MPTSTKLDLYARHKEEYVAPKAPVLVTVKPARYLAICGKGAPGSETFQGAVGALYNVAFAVKMARKHAGRDYAVSKLEGLWWGQGSARTFVNQPTATWNWQLLIRVPDWIQKREVGQVAAGLVVKGKARDVLKVELVTLNEGRSVQMLHVGPYDREAGTIREMAEFAAAHGLKLQGKHHEIYLSDPRRIPPAKLRTILRYPAE
jgi:hypothetical protein